MSLYQMTEDLNLDLDSLEDAPKEEHIIDKRIKNLTEKVRLTSEERDEQKHRLEESMKKVADLEKENVFNTGFVDILANHSAAKDHKDEIKAKVLAGYSVEDAAFAVLGKAGKLGQPVQSAPPRENPAGGSAVNQPITGGEKKISELSRDEKRTRLIDLEARGDISIN